MSNYSFWAGSKEDFEKSLKGKENEKPMTNGELEKQVKEINAKLDALHAKLDIIIESGFSPIPNQFIKQ